MRPEIEAQIAAFNASAPKAKTRRASPEGDLQEVVVRVVRAALLPPAKLWFCPNGGNLTKAQRGKFKARGLLAGVSDLHLVWPEQGYGVIEMKAPKGDDPNVEQEAFMADVEACGHRRGVARSLEEVLVILARWGVPMRTVRL